MVLPGKLGYITVDEYLALEERASTRHEYVDGVLFAMSGATRRHNVIAGNIFASLHNFLSGTPCRPYMEAVKARVEKANCFYYPDVMVACDSFDADSVYTDVPVLIVEVLSPSTAGTDRREKLINYRHISSLREYLIVHQRKKRVEVYRRNGDDWEILLFGAGDDIILESLPTEKKLTLSVDSIYDNAFWKRHGDGSLEVREESDFEPEWLSAEEADAIDW